MGSDIAITSRASAEPPAVVAHFVPEDGIGGVEVAARAAAAALGGTLHLHFLANDAGTATRAPHTTTSKHATLDPRSLLRAVACARRSRAKVLVFSLWKAAPAFLLLKLLFPSRAFVVFLHAPISVHALDRLFTSVMVALADAVWVDSQETLVGHRLRGKPTRVISYVARVISARPSETPRPHFIFWGRLAKQKNLIAALNIVAEVARQMPATRFDIIGRDDGELPAIKAHIRDLDLERVVHVHGELDFPAITALAKDARFYLQTSLFEGMAASVVEAMQLGLVPVVTPVGEISRYCTDKRNAIIVGHPERAAKAITDVIASPATYRSLSTAAVATWAGRASYQDDFLAAARAALP